MARFVAVRAVSFGIVVGVLAMLMAWLVFLVWLSTQTITWLWHWL